MDELNNENIPNESENPRPANPRRKKRSQMQIFKEAYLPVIILGLAALLILVFIIGSISRSIQKSKLEKEASIQASASEQAVKDALDTEAQRILVGAAKLAEGFDYNSAVSLIDSFSGNVGDYPELSAKRAEYAEAARSMVEWSDPNKVVNLSFHMLIADPARAFENEDFGNAYNRNFVTTEEFSKILQGLYDNDYILVDMDDFITHSTDALGNIVYTGKSLYLPAGKKPLIITQTGVNYYNYMIDSDDDRIADKDGAGFASRLVVDANGNLACEIVNADGTVSTGAYDLVPILDAFIAAHPDFSYGGAKATLAVTGYDGLFGYRTNADAKETLGEEAYNNEVKGATKVINALREAGYTIACYTYGNIPYGDYTSPEVQADQTDWTNEVTPLLGAVDILVLAQESDLESYSGESIEVLKTAGYKYFMGFCTEGTPWAQGGNGYFRMGRLLVTGSNLAYNSDWFTGMFDTTSLLDPSRGDVPG